jgi:monoamine oxidase
VVIVGGGLAGLYAAYKLEKQGTPYLLLEAKPQLGGRILGVESKQHAGHFFDLGPTWVFPHQQKIQRLAKQLNVNLFEHYAIGDVLYQMSGKTKPKRMIGAGDLQLFKVQGGCHSLISALMGLIDHKNICTGTLLTNIDRSNNLWQLSVTHNGTEHNYSVSELMLATPPRMVANLVADKPLLSKTVLSNALLSEELLVSLQNSQTWMAGQAKFLVSYSSAFWRELGLSGQIFSQTGPMVEVHDASTAIDFNHGLFGFIGVPASQRNQYSEQQIKDACIAQLVACFGSTAQDYTDCYLQDWAADPLISTTQDGAEASRHPDFMLSTHMEELESLHLHLVGSEFAINEPGYLEGAIDAVDNSALFSKIS